MSKKHLCAWLGNSENRGNLHGYLAIIKKGVLEELETLPQDFLDEWKSASSGAGPFHYAANHAANPSVVVPFLKSRGLDPNDVSLKGGPVLGHALNRAKGETLEWCQALEQAGARVDRMPCKGVSLLVAGVQANRPELVAWAVERGAKRTYPDTEDFRYKAVPDQHKIFHCQPDRPLLPGAQALEDLLPATQEDLDRQLLLSIRQGYFLWAEHFLAQGADLRARDAFGNTALHGLADRIGSYRRFNDPKCMEWVHLVAAAGVEIGACNGAGRTPYDLLVAEWDMEDVAGKFLAKAHEGAGDWLARQTQAATSQTPRPRF